MKTHYGVVGGGPVGRVFAGLLRQAGHRVTLLCRSNETLQVLKRYPVVIHGKMTGSAQLEEVTVSTGEFASAGPEVVLVCTKSVDTEHALAGILQHEPRDDMLFVCCQNGIDTERVVDRVAGAGRGLRMVLNMGCDITCGNEVEVIFNSHHVLSQPPDVAVERVERIAADLRQAGLTINVSADWRTEVFRKALLNSSLGSLCAVTRHCMGCLMNFPESRAMVEDLLREGMAISRAEGIDLPDAFLGEAMHYLDQGGEHKPSILVDVERGRITENEFLCGELARLARHHNVPAPTISFVDKILRCTESAR